MKPKNKRRVVVDSGPSKPKAKAVTVLEHKSAGPIKGKTISRVLMTETAKAAPVHSQKTPMRPVSGIDAERRAIEQKRKLSPVAAAALEAADGAEKKPKAKAPARVLETVGAASQKGQKSGMPEKRSKGDELPPIFVADEDMLFDSLFGETG